MRDGYRPTLYDLEPADLSSFATARYRIAHSLEIRCTIERMMEALKDNSQWLRWAGPMKKAVWTSERREVNCTRDVHLLGGILLQEVFFHWEEGVRVSFLVRKASVPGLKLFAEDHRMTRIEEKRTRLDFTLAFEANGAARWFAPVVFTALKVALPKMLRNYQRLLESETAV